MVAALGVSRCVDRSDQSSPVKDSAVLLRLLLQLLAGILADLAGRILCRQGQGQRKQMQRRSITSATSVAVAAGLARW